MAQVGTNGAYGKYADSSESSQVRILSLQQLLRDTKGMTQVGTNGTYGKYVGSSESS